MALSKATIPRKVQKHSEPKSEIFSKLKFELFTYMPPESNANAL